MIAAADRYFTLTYAGDLATATCILCTAFELVIERSEAGQKVARDRTALHLRAHHECTSRTAALARERP